MSCQHHEHAKPLACQHPDFLADKAANTSVSSQNAAVFKQRLK